MTYVLVRHTIEDWDKWKPVFEGHRQTRIKGGEMEEQIFKGGKSPNDVTMLFKWDSARNAKTFFNSEELKNRLAKAGVRGKPDVSFLDEVELMAA